MVRRAKLCGFALLIHTSGLIPCQVAILVVDDVISRFVLRKRDMLLILVVDLVSLLLSIMIVGGAQ